MKWTFHIQNKFKTALLFLVVVVTILGCNFLEEHYMSEMDESVASIYKDRLMPEADLFYMNNHMFNRRLALEKFLLSPDAHNQPQLQAQLARHHYVIDSLIAIFETTYLVPEESHLLAALKANVGQYRQLELQYLQGANQAGMPMAYEQQMIPVFNQIQAEMVAMTRIQTTIGEKLYHEAHILKGSAWAVSYLQIAVVILVTLATNALLFSAKSVVPTKLQKHQLN